MRGFLTKDRKRKRSLRKGLVICSHFWEEKLTNRTKVSKDCKNRSKTWMMSKAFTFGVSQGQGKRFCLTCFTKLFRLNQNNNCTTTNSCLKSTKWSMQSIKSSKTALETPSKSSETSLVSRFCFSTLTNSKFWTSQTQ